MGKKDFFIECKHSVSCQNVELYCSAENICNSSVIVQLFLQTFYSATLKTNVGIIKTISYVSIHTIFIV